jgi:hypothetical protein
VTNRVRWLVTGVVACAVLAPAVWPHASDGFPISTYPMFTSERGRVIGLDTAVLVAGDRRVRLSPEVIGGTDEVVLASVLVSDAIAEGPVALQRLCGEIAERLDRPGTVEIVTETHDTIALLRHGGRPLSTVVHRRCPAGEPEVGP